MSLKEILFIRNKGFFIYFLCGNLHEAPISVFMTLKSLIGGMGLKGFWPIIGSKIHEYQRKASIDMVKELLNYEWERLPFRVL